MMADERSHGTKVVEKKRDQSVTGFSWNWKVQGLYPRSIESLRWVALVEIIGPVWRLCSSPWFTMVHHGSPWFTHPKTNVAYISSSNLDPLVMYEYWLFMNIHWLLMNIEPWNQWFIFKPHWTAISHRWTTPGRSPVPPLVRLCGGGGLSQAHLAAALPVRDAQSVGIILEGCFKMSQETPELWIFIDI